MRFLLSTRSREQSYWKGTRRKRQKSDNWYLPKSNFTIEDTVEKVSGTIDNYFGVLQSHFHSLSTLELELSGTELKKQQLLDIFSNSNVSKVKFSGCDSDSLVKIEANRIPF